MIEAKVICDSITDHAPRLHTQLWRHPKFIHQEALRHRRLYFQDNLGFDPDFSFSVSSSRAIPFAKLLAEVRDDALRAAPVYWGAEQKGMSPGGELTGQDLYEAQETWRVAAEMAADYAEMSHKLGLHKSICNRIIEPFIHVNCLVTGTAPGWMNFFGLRLDKAADPTLRALAEAAWRAWNESTPTKLEPGQWHLPFVDMEDVLHISGRSDADWARLIEGKQPYEFGDMYRDALGKPGRLVKVSVGRCARLSYLSFETNKRSTIEEDLALYQRLVGSTPLHASPAEHQATPDEQHVSKNIGFIGWLHAKEAGNLGPGWRQYRKMLPNEAVAPLPEGY
jgi:Thymidylate synthase complementing protein